MKSTTTDSQWWFRLFRTARRVPTDLVAVAGFVFVADVVLLAPLTRGTALRPLFGLPLLFFFPGYALQAVLFPGRSGGVPDWFDRVAGAADDRARSIGDRGLDRIERLALSFGLSIVVLPLLGLVLAAGGWGLALVPALVAVNLVIAGGTLLATVHRWHLPPQDRYRVPYRPWIDDLHSALSGATRVDAALNLALLLSVLLAVGGLSYALVAPQQGAAYTGVTLLAENEAGTLVASGYPAEYVRGESEQLVVGIENHEHRPVEYTVVVELQRVRVSDGAVTLVEREELDRLSATVADGETAHVRHTVTPTMIGERLRLTYYLYKGDAPADPSAETAYRHLYLWIDVSGQA